LQLNNMAMGGGNNNTVRREKGKGNVKKCRGKTKKKKGEMFGKTTNCGGKRWGLEKKEMERVGYGGAKGENQEGKNLQGGGWNRTKLRRGVTGEK